MDKYPNNLRRYANAHDILSKTSPEVSGWRVGMGYINRNHLHK